MAEFDSTRLPVFDVIVDEEDGQLLSEHKWHVNSCGYVVRYIAQKVIIFHRVIVGAKDGEEVDHINGNRLDNRRENLRICSHAENMKNRKINENNTSGYKGVFLDPSRSGANPWRARIHVDGRKINLGRFASADLAHRAYVDASLKYHGVFARKA